MTKWTWAVTTLLILSMIVYFALAAKVIGLWPCATETSTNCTWYN